MQTIKKIIVLTCATWGMQTSFANYFIKLYHNRSFYSNDFSKSLLFSVESKHFLLYSPISHFFPNSIGETY